MATAYEDVVQGRYSSCMSIPTEVTNASIGASDSLVKSPPTDAIDVRDHGAKLDGSHDDSAAIQNALDSASKGDTVYIPEGTARIGTRIHLDERHSGVTLQGSGSQTHLRLRSGISQNYQLLRVNPDGAVTDLTIRDLRFDGQSSRQYDRHMWGIQVLASGSGDNNNLIENVWVHDFAGSNIHLRSPGTTLRFASVWDAKNWHGVNVACDIDDPSRPVVIEYCYARTNGIHGIDASGGHSVIRHVLSEENGWGGKNTLATMSSEWVDVVFRNNDQIGFMTTGPTGSIKMDRVMAEGNGKSGFYIQGGGDNLRIGEMVAIGNGADNRLGNIFITDAFPVTADSIKSGGALNGPGLNINAEPTGTIHVYTHDGQNPTGALENDSAITVESTTEESVNPLPTPTNPSVRDSSGPSYDHLVEIDGANVSELTTYSITVSDGIEKSDEVGTTNSRDTVDGTTASGIVLGGIDAYAFAGELTDTAFTGDVQGLVVRVDGVEVPLNELVPPENILTITPDETTEDQQDPIEFVVKTSKPIRTISAESLTFYEDDTVVVGFSYWWPTQLAFDGSIVEAHVPPNASVTLNGDETLASEL